MASAYLCIKALDERLQPLADVCIRVYLIQGGITVFEDYLMSGNDGKSEELVLLIKTECSCCLQLRKKKYRSLHIQDLCLYEDEHLTLPIILQRERPEQASVVASHDLPAFLPLYHPHALAKPSIQNTILRLQQAMCTIAAYYDDIPTIKTTGHFDEESEAAVIAIQQLLGLPCDGVVTDIVWDLFMNMEQELKRKTERPMT